MFNLGAIWVITSIKSNQHKLNRTICTFLKNFLDLILISKVYSLLVLHTNISFGVITDNTNETLQLNYEQSQRNSITLTYDMILGLNL